MLHTREFRQTLISEWTLLNDINRHANYVSTWRQLVLKQFRAIIAVERSIATDCAAIKAGRSAAKGLSERLAAGQITGLLSMQILMVAVIEAWKRKVTS